MIIKNGPLIPEKATEDRSMIPKKPQEFNTDDFVMMGRNAKAKKLLLNLEYTNTRVGELRW